MKIALGSDHAGYVLKGLVKEYLNKKEIEFTDYGAFKIESVDYPEYGYKVCQAIVSGECDLGILICGTGIGMSMTANKIKGIRAAVVHSVETAKLSRLHNDANVLCLGGRTLDENLACEIVDVWLSTSFEGGRHAMRVNLISQLTGL